MNWTMMIHQTTLSRMIAMSKMASVMFMRLI